MSTPPQPTPPPRDRQLSWIERVFLGNDANMRPLYKVVLFVIAVFLLNIEVGGIVFTFTRNLPLRYQFLWNSLALGIAFLLLSWFFLRVADGRKFSALGLTFRRGWGRELSLGFALGVTLQLLVMATLLATFSVHYSAGDIINLHFLRQAAELTALFALAAAVEELSFRGYAFQRLIDAVGAPTALVASSILFGLGHLGNPSATLFSTLNTILAGLLLGLPYIRTRSMWMQIGLHWSWNLTMAILVSLPVSGITFTPSLLTARESGPAWLTGAHYGPEGGAVVTIVSIAAIAWLLRTRHLTPSPAAPEDLQ
jgi:membrane protease YdiL (CAAX protease family)